MGLSCFSTRCQSPILHWTSREGNVPSQAPSSPVTWKAEPPRLSPLILGGQSEGGMTCRLLSVPAPSGKDRPSVSVTSAGCCILRVGSLRLCVLQKVLSTQGFPTPSWL